MSEPSKSAISKTFTSLWSANNPVPKYKLDFCANTAVLSVRPGATNIFTPSLTNSISSLVIDTSSDLLKPPAKPTSIRALSLSFLWEFSEDLSISYLFDAYRYAFEHIKGYKAFLEEEVLNEETGEVEINSETIEEGIQNITDLVSKHYDDPSSFTFNDYISKINSAQNALIKLYSNKRIKELERIRRNIASPIDSKRHFNDAKIFFNSYINNSPNLKILCIGLRENAVNTVNRIINIEIVFKTICGNIISWIELKVINNWGS